MVIWSKWPSDWLLRFDKEIDLNFQKTDLDWDWTRHWLSTKSKSFWFLELFVHVISWILRRNSFKLQIYVFSKFWAFDQKSKKVNNGPKIKFSPQFMSKVVGLNLLSPKRLPAVFLYSWYYRSNLYEWDIKPTILEKYCGKRV